MKINKTLAIGICFFVLGCNGIRSIKGALTRLPPYEEYLQSLEEARLLESAMVKAWQEAGKKVFDDSVMIELPFAETGFFQAGEPKAHAYQFDVKEGQVLTVEGDVHAPDNARIFQDLFVWKNNEWEHLEHADSTFTLKYEFKDDYVCLLRIQPELLVDAYYSINIALTPVLVNPVSGASNRSIGSFYGDPRDGGRRQHEGVDIFAAKGTPVIAPTDGYVYRLGNTNLGGKVVWMRDKQRGHAYYFAHLDSQLVAAGTVVKQGDTLGTVGNTGNARTTPPHLHFGIYQSGSRDPINYIRVMEQIVERLPADTTFQSLVYKVGVSRLNLRSGPGEGRRVIDQLEQDTYVKIIGKSTDWYRIALPDKRQGYVFGSLIEPAVKGTILELPQGEFLYSDADSSAIPIAFVERSADLEILARFSGFTYVKTEEGVFGWLAQKKDES